MSEQDDSAIGHVLCLFGIHKPAEVTVNHDPLNHPRYNQDKRICDRCDIRLTRWH